MGPIEPETAIREADHAQYTHSKQGTGGAFATGAILDVCPIGKEHKGKRWYEVPTEFLEWILREVSDKPDISRAAAGELSKRRDASEDSSSIHARPSSASDDDLPPLDSY